MQIITDKDVQAVTESFNAVIKELNRVNDDIKQVIADLAMEGKLDKVTESTASATVLTNFTQEVANLSTRWKNGVSSTTPNVSTQQRQLAENVTRGSKRTRLRVTFIQDNKIVNTRSAIDTFVDTLILFKLDEVSKLRMKTINSKPLVSKLESDKHYSLCRASGDWYINYPNTTKGKRSCLLSIGKKLGIAIKVDII